jgi:hypothetical protein
MRAEIITSYPNAELERKWLDFLPRSSYVSHYTSPGFFKEPFWKNRNPFAVLIFDEDEVAGVVTGLREGKRIVCGLDVRPQFSFAPSSDRKETVKAFVEAFYEMAQENAELIAFYCPEQIEEFTEFGYTEKRATGSAEVLMLDLSNGAEEVFKGFSQSRRSDLRKAMREKKVQVSQIETEGELKELYQIHLDWCARKKIAPDTWEIMQSIFGNRDYHRIFIAKHGRQVIAGSYFRFCPGGIFEYSGNNSIPEFQHLRPNDLLVWNSIEWACAQGFKRYSLGASHLFLRRFGGTLVSSYRYQLDRTFLKKHEKRESVVELAIKTYQSLPPAARQTIKRMTGRI